MDSMHLTLQLLVLAIRQSLGQTYSFPRIPKISTSLSGSNCRTLPVASGYRRFQLSDKLFSFCIICEQDFLAEVINMSNTVSVNQKYAPPTIGPVSSIRIAAKPVDTAIIDLRHRYE